MIGTIPNITFSNITWIKSLLFYSIFEELMTSYVAAILVVGFITLSFLKIINVIDEWVDVKICLKIILFILLGISLTYVLGNIIFGNIKGVKIDSFSKKTLVKLDEFNKEKITVMKLSEFATLNYNKNSNILYIYKKHSNVPDLKLDTIEKTINDFDVKPSKTPDYLY